MTTTAHPTAHHTQRSSASTAREHDFLHRSVHASLTGFHLPSQGVLSFFVCLLFALNVSWTNVREINAVMLQHFGSEFSPHPPPLYMTSGRIYPPTRVLWAGAQDTNKRTKRAGVRNGFYEPNGGWCRGIASAAVSDWLTRKVYEARAFVSTKERLL